MLNYIRLIKILLFLLVVVLQKPEALSQVSQLEYKEKVELVNKSNVFDGYLYYFISFPSCQSCLQNMFSILNLTENFQNLNTKIFISGISEEYLAQFKKENNLKYDLILDNIGVYHKFYKMAKTNSLIIISNNSEFIDAFNFSEDFDVESFTKTLNSIRDLPYSNKPYSNKLIQFKKDNELLTTAEGIVGIYSPKYKHFYFTQINNGLIYTADSNGFIYQEYNIKNIYKMNKFTILNFSWRILDSIIVIQGYNTDTYEFENFILEYDINDNSCKKIDIANNLMSEFIELKGNPLNQGYVLSRISLEEKKENEVFIFYNSQGNVINSSNRIDTIYTKLSLAKSFRQIFDYSNSKMFSIQLFSKNFSVFDKIGNYIVDKTFEQSLNLRETKVELPNIQSKSDWVDFSNQTSYYQYMKVDDNDNILLAYFNYVVPNGIRDLESPSVKKEWYYDIINNRGKLKRSLQITERSPWIAFFNNETIIYYHSTDNIASATIYY